MIRQGQAKTSFRARNVNQGNVISEISRDEVHHVGGVYWLIGSIFRLVWTSGQRVRYAWTNDAEEHLSQEKTGRGFE
jgi:hypothetical protein